MSKRDTVLRVINFQLNYWERIKEYADKNILIQDFKNKSFFRK